MDMQSVLRGHHVYKENNIHDRHAVAVMKDAKIVGHAPCELSRIPTTVLLQTLWGGLLRDNRQMKVWCEAQSSLHVQGEGKSEINWTAKTATSFKELNIVTVYVVYLLLTFVTVVFVLLLNEFYYC